MCRTALQRHRIAARGVSLRDRTARPGRGPRDRGAVLVHVAVATMGLLAFSALSIDVGTLWVARAEAQNAADAAALSGGVSLAYIDESDVDAARASASSVAQAHTIWGAPVVPAEVTTTVGACPAGSPGPGGTCMGVVVARNAASGTPLPVFFSRLIGATGNEMHASASAKVMLGNTTSCPRPLAIVDRWNDHDGTWSMTDTFARYDPAGNPTGVNDVYVPSGPTTTGSGWTLPHVTPSPAMTFHLPVPPSSTSLPPVEPLAANQMISFDMPRSGGSSEPSLRFQENLDSCVGEPLALGETVPYVHPHRDYFAVNPLRRLIDQDGAAYWDDGVQAVRGSSFPVSPRLITIAVVDPEHYSRQDRTASRPDLLVRNLVGFFVEDVGGLGSEVVIRGRLVRTAGTFSGDAPAITDQAAFLRAVALVR